MNLLSLSSCNVQILTILIAREKGILSVTCAGWQELGSKYWFLFVSFLYKSVIIFPSIILQDVSRNWIASSCLQSHAGFSTLGGVVWDIVNFMLGWMLLSSDRNRCRDLTLPVYTISIAKTLRPTQVLPDTFLEFYFLAQLFMCFAEPSDALFVILLGDFPSS